MKMSEMKKYVCEQEKKAWDDLEKNERLFADEVGSKRAKEIIDSERTRWSVWHDIQQVVGE
jgi:hypothetical protein